MYKLEPDLMGAGNYYIYYYGENETGLKLVVYRDFNLAREIVDYLNSRDNNKKSV